MAYNLATRFNFLPFDAKSVSSLNQVLYLCCDPRKIVVAITLLVRDVVLNTIMYVVHISLADIVCVSRCSQQ